MKKIALGAVALIATGVAPALGADLAAPAYTKAPAAVAPTYNWAGFYVGGDVGWLGSKQGATTDPFPSPGFGGPPVGVGLAGFGQTPTNNSLSSNGFVGGIYGGYNWQVGGLVAGIEGDVSGLNRKVSNTQVSSATFLGFPVADFNMNVTASNSWLASLRGRLGVAAGSALFYATGGAAWTNTSYSASAVGFNNPPNINVLAGTSAATSWSNTKTGFAVGAGMDWMLPSSNWIFRAEYLYYQFGGSSGLMSTLGNGLDICDPGQCNWGVNTGTLRINTVRVGLSYKFGAPVRANY